jgi:hypothetical protein
METTKRKEINLTSSPNVFWTVTPYRWLDTYLCSEKATSLFLLKKYNFGNCLLPEYHNLNNNKTDDVLIT